MRYQIVLLLIATVCLASCSTASKQRKEVRFAIQSTNDKSAITKRTYTLVPAERLPAQDVNFNEYAPFVHRALEKRGYQPAKSPQTADLKIIMEYGIADVPTPQATSAGADPKESSIAKPTTPVFARFLKLTAVPAKANNATTPLAPLWQTTVTGFGHDQDLKKEFPHLVAGGFKYFGEDTGATVNTFNEFSPRDPALRMVQGDTTTLQPAKGELVFVGDQCKTFLIASKDCEMIKGLKFSEGQLEVAASIKNTSPITWKNIELEANCGSRGFTKVQSGELQENLEHLGLFKTVVPDTFQPGDTKPITFIFKQNELRKETRISPKCDVAIKRADEVVL